ncbi:hypothetical protein BJY04DRAFT_17668 [Aspergillus karnatakaensis]|uniref:uncharacterized protein n=1 Tax=Aspergillus karnatakaensis TaxID=1810916 RepID=UPI003CCCCAF8
MRQSRILQSAISLVALLSHSQITNATPLGHGLLEVFGLEKRCDNPCGYYSQLCCASGETCTTDDNDQAVCSSGGSGSGSGSGTWETYSSTWVVTETDVQTMTSVWSSWVASPTGGSGTCKASLGETECGDDCCGAAYICNKNKKCVLGATTSIGPTHTANPPSRPTDSNTVTETATATQGFEAPVTTDGSEAIGVDAPDDDSGLSGGAIAGIVIGTLAGVFLLFLLCLCLCFKGLLNSILACLGIGRKRREETYVEEHHSHHTHRPPGRTWFGTKPSGDHEGEGKSRWGSMATIGIILGAIALCLGLRRKKDQDEKSDYTYPSYYSYYTSTTSSSSDRRTRRSRRSGRSRSRTHS